MPCDSQVIQSVNLEAANLDLLEAAIKFTYGAVAWSGKQMHFRLADSNGRLLPVWFEAGKLQSNYLSQSDLSEAARMLKVAYSKQVVLAAAKKAGWQVQANKANVNKMVLSRRA